ncbi:SEC-C metal-binding domain-containing protein [Virgibacillus natechei]|uniref:SEC-C metal-binding domain-containing protein n=1 Tax=Virgibacillus sp. CBA3643 TaxID=2942278 RepID=UPI0035A329D2
MSEIGRNVPCPCGSGKKYSKCCGASNVVEITPELFNAELEDLHTNLIDMAFEEYSHVFAKVHNQYPQLEFMDDPYRMDYYLAGISAWAIMSEPIDQNGQNIFDIFYKRQQKKIKHARTRETLAEWSDSTPSVYEIISSREASAEMATIKDVLSGDTYTVPFPEASFVEGNLVIGILIPFVEHHEFLFTIIELSRVNIDEVKDIAKDYQVEGMKEDFPEFLAEALDTEVDIFNFEWRNPSDEEVADIFRDHMQHKYFPEEMIKTGELMWNAYCQLNKPAIKNPEAYAAALEYVVLNIVNLDEDEHVTQKQIAEEYGITPGTVSQKVRQLEDSLNDDLGEELRKIMVEVFDDEGFFDDEILDDLLEDDLENDPYFQKSRMELHQFIEDLSSVMEEQDLSKEEMSQFLNDLIENPELSKPDANSSRSLAQDKLDKAQQVNGTEKRRKLVEEALDIYPNSPDAYVLLAEDAASIHEAYQLLHKGIIAGEKDLGKDFFWENKGHFWMMMETRPYMRVKAAFADTCTILGETETAMEHYEELLELNRSDNQGIRYDLLPLYLETEDYDEAQELLDQFKEDQSANFLYNRALLTYFTKGVTSNTKALLKEAVEQNPYVIEYLTGKKAIPEEYPNYIGMGDEQEAIAYVQENIHLWSGEDQLLKELK